MTQERAPVRRIRNRRPVGGVLWVLIAGWIVIFAGAEVAAQSVNSATASSDSGQIVGTVFVNRSPIFDVPQSLGLSPYQLANALHKVTREETILKEAGVMPGQRIDAADVAEIERILRRLDLFASVSVQLKARDTAGVADLHIRTRDRLSIVAGASGSFVGGVGEFGFTVGERNVAGLGDSILLSYSGNTDDELRGAITYSDLHFIKPSQRAIYSVGRTEEGSFYGLGFSRPFKSLNQKRSWSLQLSGVEQDIDFYERGLSVVQVPQDGQSLALESFWRSGSRQLLWSRGVTLRYDDRIYQPSRGTQASSIQSPSDSVRIFAGLVLALNQRNGFRKVSGLDTLRFTQDLAFGNRAEVRVGFAHKRDITLDRSQVNPIVSARLSTAFSQGESNFFRMSLSASTMLDELNSNIDEERAWSVAASAKAFILKFSPHTLAVRIDYKVADGGSDLPVQQTLGEDSGLRGYASRFFSGRERLRINLEDRIDPGWRLGVFDFGVVGFVDAGWVAEAINSDRSFNTSAGLGLRLGSNVLLGSGVFRMDLAFPFDSEDEKPLLSVSLGQVFSF